MGIQVEFNPDLALRNISEYNTGNKLIEECIPEKLEVDNIYPFLKRGQRLYWLHGEIPLIETKGEGILSRPKASIIIMESTHILQNGEIWTKGMYKVAEIFNDSSIHFECFDKVGTRIY